MCPLQVVRELAELYRQSLPITVGTFLGPLLFLLFGMIISCLVAVAETFYFARVERVCFTSAPFFLLHPSLILHPTLANYPLCISHIGHLPNLFWENLLNYLELDYKDSTDVTRMNFVSHHVPLINSPFPGYYGKAKYARPKAAYMGAVPNILLVEH